MPKYIDDKVKQEVIRLRVEERLSIEEIRRRTRLSQGTIATLLKDLPLTDEELAERASQSAIKSNMARKYDPEKSKFALLQNEELSTAAKGRTAEAAVRLRLAKLNYEVWKPDFEGSRVDFLVSRPGNDKLVRLQVKWAKRWKWGRPSFALRNGEHGRIRRLTSADCDFVVGYDLETDVAYVVPIEICEGKDRKTCDEEYAEAWHLLGV